MKPKSRLKDVGVVACIVATLVLPGRSQTRISKEPALKINIYKIEELTAPEIDGLDRNKTLFLLPVGMLEEHGPHLPIGTDTYQVDFVVGGTAKRLKRMLPGWTILVLPDLAYGEGGANGFSGNPVHPGTYGLRYTTLRSIVADIGGQVAQNKFKWIFVIHGHSAPMHNVAINEACDFVSHTFHVTMLNLTSLRWADADYSAKSDQIAAKYYSARERKAQGLDLHAGVSETSAMLAVSPQSVRPIYKRLPDRVGNTTDELGSIAEKPGWEGYFSSPRKADSAFGQESMDLAISVNADFIVRALNGQNFSTHARFPEGAVPKPYTEPPEERAFTDKFERWLQEQEK